MLPTLAKHQFSVQLKKIGQYYLNHKAASIMTDLVREMHKKGKPKVANFKNWQGMFMLILKKFNLYKIFFAFFILILYN